MSILPSEIGVYWHNQRTGEAEYLTAAPVERLEEFISQSASAQNLYRLYQDMGMTPLEAATEVLRRTTDAQERTGAGSAELAPHPEGH